MSDVFISYKREERRFAKGIAEALSKLGYEAWWDVELLPGAKFADEIKEVIKKSKITIVIWSLNSINSDFVRAEADLSRKYSKVISVVIDDCELPLPFNNQHYLDLRDWDGEGGSNLLDPLIAAIQDEIAPTVPDIGIDNAEVDLLVRPEAEAEFWKAISQADRQSPEEYLRYLDRFGTHATFADLARLRISNLKRDAEHSQKLTPTKIAAAIVTGAGVLTAVMTVIIDWSDVSSILFPKNLQTPLGVDANEDLPTPDDQLVPQKIPFILKFGTSIGPDHAVEIGERVEFSLPAEFDEKSATLLSWEISDVPLDSRVSSDSDADERISHPREFSFSPDRPGDYTVTATFSSDNDVYEASATVVSPPSRLLKKSIVDASPVPATNSIVYVSSEPRELGMLSSDADVTFSLSLPKTPTSLAIAPSGDLAAVGHDGWISIVNLATREIEQNIPISVNVFDLVFAGTGDVYYTPDRDQWTHLYRTKIKTGEETKSEFNIYAQTRIKLHGSGGFIYGADNGLTPSDIEKYILDTNGRIVNSYDSPYHGDHDFCGDLWLPEKGHRIFTKCGTVLTSSEIREKDLQYRANLKNVSRITSLIQLDEVSEVVVLESGIELQNLEFDISGNLNSRIIIFDSPFLEQKNEFELPSIIIEGRKYPVDGRYILKTGERTFFVLSQIGDGYPDEAYTLTLFER